MAIWRKRTAWSITKATNTHSEYVILIAFSLQQWLHKRSSALRYTCTVCLVITARVFTERYELEFTYSSGSVHHSGVVFYVRRNRSLRGRL